MHHVGILYDQLLDLSVSHARLSLVYSVDHRFIQSARVRITLLKRVTQPRNWSECLDVPRMSVRIKINKQEE